jgi:hypothetical protein
MLQSQNLKNTIDEHMKSLPHDVQEAIHGSSWERKILEIGRKYGLHVDQLEILQTELSLAVLGLVGRDEFVRETMREAHIPKQTMELMVFDINRDIFEPIRDRLKQTRVREEVEDEIAEEAAETNNDDNNETVSGLYSHEEKELEKHGLSFDFKEETPVPQNRNTYTAPETVVNSKPSAEIETSKPSPVLLKPLILNTGQQKKERATTFEDALATKIKPRNIDVGEEIQKPVEAKEENTQQEEIQTQEPNYENLPGAKTDMMQAKITDSRGTFYQKTDPYREPIA